MTSNDNDKRRAEEAARRAEEAARQAEERATEIKEGGGPGKKETYGHGRRDDE